MLKNIKTKGKRKSDTKFGFLIYQVPFNKTDRARIAEQYGADFNIKTLKKVVFGRKCLSEQKLEEFVRLKSYKGYRLKPLLMKKLLMNSKCEAYKAREGEILKLQSGGSKKLYCSQIIESKYSVYALELKSEVLKEPKFKKANPQLTGNDIICLYIGSTSKSREDRFKEHIGEAVVDKTDKGQKSIVRPYVYRTFSEANVSYEFLKGRRIENLSQADALCTEEYFGESLKSPNIGTYYGI